MKGLPRSIKRGIIVHFLFDDLFYNFRYFFNPQKLKDSKFLYDIAFGLMPRHFSEKEDEDIILDEEEEVLEMYFIVSGSVGVGYHLYQQPLEKQRYVKVIYLSANTFFGDYYLCNNIKAEFVHVAVSNVEAFGLSKKFLMSKIFPKYPHIYQEIKDQCKYRYNSTVKNEIQKHKQGHLAVVNMKSTYNVMHLNQKTLQHNNEQILNKTQKNETFKSF